MSISSYLNFFWYDSVTSYKCYFTFICSVFVLHALPPIPVPRSLAFLVFVIMNGIYFSPCVRHCMCSVEENRQDLLPSRIFTFNSRSSWRLEHLQKSKSEESIWIWTSLLIVVSRFHTGYVLHLWLESHFSLFLLFFYFLFLLFPKYKQVAVWGQFCWVNFWHHNFAFCCNKG